MSSSGDRGRYDVFLSHSSSDRMAAGRIHRLLEDYRFPREYKRRRLRVFHYAHDQRAEADLDAALESHIANSDFLALVASPDSATRSKISWEIQTFLDQEGRTSDHICILQIEGDAPANLPAVVRSRLANPVWCDLELATSGWIRW